MFRSICGADTTKISVMEILFQSFSVAQSRTNDHGSQWLSDFKVLCVISDLTE